MARVFFVVFQVNRLFEDWARGLTESQNEVLVWTSPQSRWQNVGSALVLTPFKKWSAPEALKALQFHFLRPAGVFHFAVQDADPQPSAAHWVLLSWAKMFRKSVVLSFLGSVPDSPLWRAFAHRADFVTFSSRDIMLRAQQKSFLRPGAKADVFWSSFPAFAESARTPGAFGRSLRQKLGPFIVIPWSGKDSPGLQMTKSIQSQGLFPVFLRAEKTQETRADFLSFSDLREDEIEDLAAEADWIVLPYANLHLVEALEWRRRSMQARRPLLVSIQQLSIYPELCIPDRTGRVIDADAEMDWSKALRRLPKGWDPTSPESKNQDSGVNALARIYRALETP